MPVALILMGIILLVSALKGTQRDLFALLKDDFSGSNNFFVWVLAFVFIIAVGYAKPLRPLSNAFLGLIILVLLVQNKGFFPSFLAQVKAGTSGKQADITPTDIKLPTSGKDILHDVSAVASSAVSKTIGKLI